MNIRKLIIEDVRCFAGRQEFEIRPITFLVGENSTGKSTALACLQTLSDFLDFGDAKLDFNVEPYNLGAFADIVRISRPEKDSFRLGIELQQQSSETVKLYLTIAERGAGSEPVSQDFKMLFGDGNEILVKKSSRQESLGEGDLRIQEKPSGEKQFVVVVSPLSFLGLLGSWLSKDLYLALIRESLSPEANKLRKFVKMHEAFYQGNIPRVHSFAPIRSRPQRTYNLLREDSSPEGSDIPMMLMNIVRVSGEQWEKLKDRLVKFGEASGLFADVHVRKLGSSTSDPFQLQINVRGPKVNLMDVGYGVSQILPVLVRIFDAVERGERETTFLMQQPEVHLHPRAQAELSSLLIEIARQRKQNFVIETHSDYMINRACIDIREGRIPHEDVSLIYLEPHPRRPRDVHVHNMKFDEQGNLLDAPSSYRQFFLKESNRFLGFEDD